MLTRSECLERLPYVRVAYVQTLIEFLNDQTPYTYTMNDPDNLLAMGRALFEACVFYGAIHSDRDSTTFDWQGRP